MKNSSKDHLETGHVPGEGNLHPEVGGHLFLQRSRLVYATRSLMESGMKEKDVEQFVATHLQSVCDESVSMQRLIDLGMDGSCACRFIPQQKAVEKGYEFPERSVTGILYENDRQIAEELLNQERESGHVLTMGTSDSSPDDTRDAVCAVMEYEHGTKPTPDDVHAIINRASKQIQVLPISA